jgi:N-acetylneuraminic acid mutarotase
LDEIEEYNSVANKWTVLQARLSVARQWLAAAYLDDSIYIFGGANDNKVEEASSATECYDMKKKKCKSTEALQTQMYLAVATSVVSTSKQVYAAN